MADGPGAERRPRQAGRRCLTPLGPMLRSLRRKQGKGRRPLAGKREKGWVFFLNRFHNMSTDVMLTEWGGFPMRCSVRLERCNPSARWWEHTTKPQVITRYHSRIHRACCRKRGKIGLDSRRPWDRKNKLVKGGINMWFERGRKKNVNRRNRPLFFPFLSFLFSPQFLCSPPPPPPPPPPPLLSTAVEGIPVSQNMSLSVRKKIKIKPGGKKTNPGPPRQMMIEQKRRK